VFTVLYIWEPGDRSRLDAYFDAVVFPDESSIRAAAHLGLYRKAAMVDAGSDGPEALEVLWELLRELESTGGPRSMVRETSSTTTLTVGGTTRRPSSSVPSSIPRPFSS